MNLIDLLWNHNSDRKIVPQWRSARGWEMNDFEKIAKNIYSSMALVIKDFLKAIKYNFLCLFKQLIFPGILSENGTLSQYLERVKSLNSHMIILTCHPPYKYNYFHIFHEKFQPFERLSKDTSLECQH